MKPVTQPLLQQAAAAFAFGCPTGAAERYGAGHINDTFAVWAADRSRRWILQRINTDTFTDPAGLMENVCGVTGYLRRQIIARGGDPERETLNGVPTRAGGSYYADGEGGNASSAVGVFMDREKRGALLPPPRSPAARTDQ